MLAVKLHKHKRPWLGKGSHLIPILSWKTGKVHIKRWINLLDYQNESRPNNKIRYITLVKIPDDHPVFLASDWGDKIIFVHLFGGIEFKPLSAISHEIKRFIMEVPDLEPEIILGKSLPPSCIKWTKNIQLLYKSNKKTRCSCYNKECFL